MRFWALHKLSSYLMMTSAVLAAVISPEISKIAMVLSLIAIFVSWFVEPSSTRSERLITLWNIATVIFFFYLAVDVGRGQSISAAGAYFLLFVLVNKLFNRHSSKDYLQAYVVSFLLLVVATTMNTDISYAICFSLFALFATWTLSLFHLRRDMEDNYLLKHSDTAQSEKVEVERILNSRRIVGAPFLLGTSLIWVGILIGSTLLFFLFPRIGFGLFVGQKRGGVALAGFQDRVELGHHGVIRDNPIVVMRVVFPSGRPSQRLRWRGSAFDHYEKGAWSHSPDLLGLSEPISPQDNLFIANLAPGLPWPITPSMVRSHLLRQNIYLEPLDVNILFAVDRPVAIEGQKQDLLRRRLSLKPRRGPLGEIRYYQARSAGLLYSAYSSILAPSPAALRQAKVLKDPQLSRYLQLPADLPPRIKALALRITAQRSTVYDRVQAVQDYLSKSYTYTLNLTHEQRYEPVDEFLFQTRRGHCEYFASAMILLLRSVGIHSRGVNGFAGGEWNRFGNYLAVRQGDAHAWVEVLFSNVGWVTFDPTPQSPIPTLAEEGPTAELRQLFDTLRLRWFRYVVEYDLRQQISMLQQIEGLFSRQGEAKPFFARYRSLIFLLGIGIVMALFLVLWRLRRKIMAFFFPRKGSELPSVTRLYERFLSLLRRAGYIKPDTSTPLEFLDLLAQKKFGPIKLVAQFTHCYYELRFGKGLLAAQESEELKSILRDLKNALFAESKR
jgi:protein-glutamine gamma-glutamyltransferase